MKIQRILLLLLISVSSLSLHAEPIVVNAGDIAPMSFTQNDRPAGIAVDILNEVSRISGLSFDIRVLPWTRAQEYTKTARDNQGVIPLSRTPEREPQYQWIALLFEQRMVFVSLGDVPAPTTIDEAKKMRIGTLSNNMYVKSMPSMGFKDVETASTEEMNVKKLQAKRFDAWLVSDLVAKNAFQNAFDPKLGTESKLNYGVTLGEPFKVYLGGSPNFSPELAKTIADAVSKLKASGKIDGILEKYR